MMETSTASHAPLRQHVIWELLLMLLNLLSLNKIRNKTRKLEKWNNSTPKYKCK